MNRVISPNLAKKQDEYFWITFHHYHWNKQLQKMTWVWNQVKFVKISDETRLNDLGYNETRL
jgi:hypothetical protein